MDDDKLDKLINVLVGQFSACEIGEDAFDVISDAVIDMTPPPSRAQAAMTACAMVMVNTARHVAGDLNKTEREILLGLFHATLEAFPEEAPKAEDLPTVKNVKRGPSPWGL